MKALVVLASRGGLAFSLGALVLIGCSAGVGAETGQGEGTAAPSGEDPGALPPAHAADPSRQAEGGDAAVVDANADGGKESGTDSGKDGGACVPTTCAAAGKSCGTILNGCGGTLTCGACGAGQSCVSGVCKASCAPTTCAAAGKNCGTIPDGCGGTLTCGACGAGQSCGSGVCKASCVPTTCSAAGKSCGTMPDGCGGTLNCGATAKLTVTSALTDRSEVCFGIGGGAPVPYTQHAASYLNDGKTTTYLPQGGYVTYTEPLGTTKSGWAQCCMIDPCLGNLMCPTPTGNRPCICLPSKPWSKPMNVCIDATSICN